MGLVPEILAKVIGGFSVVRFPDDCNGGEGCFL